MCIANGITLDSDRLGSRNVRHELRIALKNLRYGAEFFGRLFGHRQKTKSYVGNMAIMQDVLGAHNGIVGARQFLDEMSESSIPETERATGFLLGWHARGAAVADGKLRKAWKKFRRAKGFWD